MSDPGPEALFSCPLCGGSVSFLLHFRGRDYYRCAFCRGIAMHPEDHPSAEEEKARYLEHNNDTEDKRYQQFVRPLVYAVLRDFTSRHRGLDFGAGTGPVITAMLRKNGYSPEVYDPFFHPDPGVLSEPYDYIVCSEVIEHFHVPCREFSRLTALLRPGGALYCMTELYEDDIVFADWYYKNDPTHVFFYHRRSLEWIRGRFCFDTLQTGKRLIIFRKGRVKA